MFYSEPRYIKTRNGRVFKLDGWVPLLELRAGLWCRPKDYTEEFFQSGETLTAEQANNGAFFSDCGIETDNVSAFLCLFEALFHSSTCKYKSLMNFLDVIHFENGAFGDNQAITTWIDCFVSSMAAFSRCSVFDKKLSSFKDDIMQLVFKRALPGMCKKVFLNKSFNDLDVSLIAEESLMEFDKAIDDIGRVEVVFALTERKERVAKFNDLYRSCACLANRFYFRMHGYSESELRYGSDFHLLITDGQDTVMQTKLLAEFVGSSVHLDLEIIDSIEKGK